jgi:hypothetical protein
VLLKSAENGNFVSTSYQGCLFSNCRLWTHLEQVLIIGSDSYLSYTQFYKNLKQITLHHMYNVYVLHTVCTAVLPFSFVNVVRSSLHLLLCTGAGPIRATDFRVATLLFYSLYKDV